MSDWPTVDEAWSSAMDAIRSVGKGDYNQDQGFRFRGVDSVVNATGPAFREHRVKVIPKRIINVVRTEYETRRGTRMVNKEVTVEWEVRGPAGDSFTGESIGEAADAGDKSVSKAQSVAYRVFLLEALNVPTGDVDPDSESHERAAQDWSSPERAQQHQTYEKPTLTEAQLARHALWQLCKDNGRSAKTEEIRFYKDKSKPISESDADTIRAYTAGLADEIEAAKQDQEGTNVDQK